MFRESHDPPMHETVSLKLKNTLSARLQPVSFEINNLLLLLYDDDDADVLGIGLCVVLELFLKKNNIKKRKYMFPLRK